VHWANLRVTKECRRKWTGLAVALTVTFTVCDARQIGLSPSGGIPLPIQNGASLQMMRPEQKAPPLFAPLRVSNQAFASRKQASGTLRHFDGAKCFQYGLISPACRLNTLCPQPNSGESTRGPPRRGPQLSVSRIRALPFSQATYSQFIQTNFTQLIPL
jgi:hypothetical protein